jgi:hypothetical protein
VFTLKDLQLATLNVLPFCVHSVQNVQKVSVH